MLTAIRLKNWKSHQSTSITFAPGVNAIVGINGAGKSSVMQAISFALFGTFPQLQRKAVTLEDIVTRKPLQKEDASVELDFSANGNTYTVSRVIEKKGKKFVTTSAELREGSQLKEANGEAVTRLVESLLHLDYDLFTKAVYSEQNGIDYFLRLPRGTRMKEIDHMLQLERYETARARAVSLANRLARRAEDKLRLLAGLDPSNLEEQQRSLEQEIQSLKEQQSQSASLLEAAAADRQQVGQRIAELEQAVTQVQRQQSLIASLEAAIRELEPGPVPSLSTTDLAAGLGRLKKEKEAQDTARVALEKTIEAEREQLAAANAAVAGVKESIQELATVSAVCPVCESPLPDEKKASLLASREEKKAALVATAAAHAQSIIQVKEQKAALEQAIATTVAAQQELQIQQTLVERAEAQARRLQQKKQELAAISRLPPVDESQLASLRTSFAAVAVKCGSLDSTLRAQQAALSDKVSQLAQLQKQLAYIEKESVAARQASTASGQVVRFAGILQSTQESLRVAFLTTVNSALATIWPVLYPYGDFPSLELAVEDGDYLLRLQEKGRWVPAELVSGGERSAAALALRIAFSLSFLPHLRWLILDEPTHNLDAAAVKRLGEILQGNITAFADQVFLITHEERLADGLHTIRLLRDKENEMPTEVHDGGIENKYASP